jgi:3-oxoacyl-[acyl-carrier protein] reductase
MKTKNIALLTGGSRGIGKEIKKKFKLMGMDVIAPGRDVLDLSSSQSVSEFISNFDIQISALINNAGINITGSFSKYKQDDLHQMIQINLLSCLELSKLAAESNKLHSICNIGSIWSEKSFPERAIYSMTKSGLVGLTRGIAHDLSSRGIFVNSVSPGFIDTEMTSKNISKIRKNSLLKLIPLGRFGHPRAVANLVYFLCSKDNEYITAQNIVVDGGYL